MKRFLQSLQTLLAQNRPWAKRSALPQSAGNNIGV
jgi:hypothetical protein